MRRRLHHLVVGLFVIPFSLIRVPVAPDAPASLALIYFNQAELREETVGVLKGEVERVLREMGVAVEELPAPAGSNVPPRFHIGVLLRNTDGGQSMNTMGLASNRPPQPGESHKTVTVFVPHVTRTLEQCSTHPYASVHGKALGRVVAHEIVHAVIPGYGHADTPRTLMAPRLDCTFFLTSVALDPDTAVALRTALATLAAATRPSE